MNVSPLARPFPDLPPVRGVELRVARAGYKDWDRADLTLALLAEGTAVAGVFTRNICCSSEVELGRAALPHGRARALVVNAGNSNAFTGARGRAAVEGIVADVAARVGCLGNEVYVSSTGVIGVPLPLDIAQRGLATAFAAAPASWREATDAIGTTDTFAKAAHACATVAGERVAVVGIVKGSGMIAPDMATMLAYIFTDAKVAAALLQAMLTRATAGSFNAITVDSDTSTSDTVLLFATGAAEHAELARWEDAGADALYAAIEQVALELAQLVVRDGEGASKFIEVRVTGAVGDDSARRVALAIANSPLVKTAIAGEDANWGRVVMAVGKAGETADRDRLSIGFGGVTVARDGMVVEGYDEAPVAAHLRGDEVSIHADLGLGDGAATVWTCDLTHGYISINADYRS